MRPLAVAGLMAVSGGVCLCLGLGSLVVIGSLGSRPDAAPSVRSSSAPAGVGRTGRVAQIFRDWEPLTQIQRPAYEQGLIGTEVRDECTIDDITRDGRVDLDCGQRALQEVFLMNVPRERAELLTKGQRLGFTAKVRSLKVTITNDLTLDYVSSP